MNFIAWVGLASTLIAISVSKLFHINEVTAFSWLLLVVGVDVAHVYSSLYRTYFLKQIDPKLKKIMLLTRLFCFAFALVLALKGPTFFWTTLVYVAVFHFIRQQIGFLRIFADVNFRTSRWHILNEIFIYVWTGGSVLIWHLQGVKTFNWFTQNDFYYLDQFSFLRKPLAVFIAVTFAMGLLANLLLFFKKKISMNYFVLLISTFVSWFFPIVIFNSDFIFTFANVISHGLPYLILVYNKEKSEKSIFSRLEVFIPILVILAFLEEAFWDAFIWRDHGVFFDSFYFLPQLAANSTVQALALAVLILPQLTHYVLDGFIWKRKYASS
jgi:hypothetical protein